MEAYEENNLTALNEISKKVEDYKKVGFTNENK